MTDPIESARQGYEAWNSGDIETFLEYVDEEIVWVSSGVFPGLRSSYSGHKGMREFWATFMEPWETLEIEIIEILEVDESSVLGRIRFHALGRDGLEVDREMLNHLVMRDEKLLRFHGYPEWEEALADLGLDEAELRRSGRARSAPRSS